MKQFLPILFLLISFYPGIAQDNSSNTIKHIQGDTAYYYNWISKLAHKIELEDLSKTSNNFYFRFWDLGQVVEIWSDSSNVINGQITNFVFQKSSRKGIPGDTLYKRTNLTHKQVEFVSHLIDSCRILSLPGSQEIGGWGYVPDAFTYKVEFADKEKYLIRMFSHPSAYDSTLEIKMFLHFINALSDSLYLKKSREEFLSELPNRSYYSYYSGGSFQIQCVTRFFSLEYNFNSQLPFGYIFSYSQLIFNKTKINVGMSVQYNTDFKGSSDLSLYLGKYEIIDIDTGKYSLSADIGFRYRDLAFVDKENQFKNYNFDIRNYFSDIISVSIGLDYLQDNNSGKFGGVFGLSKRFVKPKISVFTKSVLYKNQFDYYFGISRPFSIKHPRYFFTWLSLYFENFYNYNSINLSVYIPLH